MPRSDMDLAFSLFTNVDRFQCGVQRLELDWEDLKLIHSSKSISLIMIVCTQFAKVSHLKRNPTKWMCTQ